MKQTRNEGTAFLEQNPEVESLDAFIIDLSGNAVGKRHPASDIPKLFENGSTFCEAMYLVDVNGECPDALGKGFSDGDPDAEAWPVPGSLRMAPWSDEPRAQCLLTLK
ncbi:MAG: glutamine synthetase family protein, partial [Hyphomicrobiales bacterium]